MSTKWDKYGPAPAGTGDLSPLGDQLRSGLEIIGTLAVFSLIFCSSLFLFITYRVIDGRLRDRQQSRRLTSLPRNSPVAMPDDNDGFVLDSPVNANSQATPTTPMFSIKELKTGAPTYNDLDSIGRRRAPAAVPNIRQGYKGYHPLLVLIYMLLIADIIQSASFIPNLVWVTHDAIMVRTETCWAQGWLRSQGDMASSMFAAAVSVNTFLMVVKGYTIPSKILWAVVGTIWTFSFLIVAAGVWSANNGAGHGGYFVRVDTWCWISSEYASTRLWTHFGWVLACFGVILVSYLATAICIRVNSNGVRMIGLRDPKQSGHHPAFLIYPLVYFICCVPMALGPMVLMAGVTINDEYFLWAGAMIASNGWLDVIVWSCTMVFLAPKDIKKAGLEEFRFLRTNSVKYGNIIWVEGGKNDGRGRRRQVMQCLPLPELKKIKGEKKGSRLEDNWDAERGAAAIGDAETSIQVQTSTTVMVENRRNSALNLFGNPLRPVSDIVSVPARVAHRF
ncbi:hypothetical protein N0V93_003014 [Gnomoniopsis smithogilvyi]|uniref:Glucose receptor Git3 N-terminal domain-containing protein n=1 Tax=Gnomoniopsis smithogilvyi TaxID=1191159 RepID=A0A9W8YVV4_9PEZI|nr:hypothetical protein N0V93_003014 [Gnomoniopsis smithogilvyi]